MLWELQQIENELDSINTQRKEIERNSSLSPNQKRIQIASLEEKRSILDRVQRELIEKIHQDPALSRMRDKQVTERIERDKAKKYSVREAELGVTEIQASLPELPISESKQALYAKYLEKWTKKKSIEREIIQAKFLEEEREPD